MLPVIPSNKPKNQGAPPRRGPQTSAVVRTTLYFLCELSGVGAGPPRWRQVRHRQSALS